jgi:hypothetical protein
MTDAQAALAQVREAMADPMLFDWARDWDRARAIRAFERSCTTANIAAILAHVEAQKAEIERLTAALNTCVWALRQPLDDWKGECERKALDEARDALKEQR